MITVKFFASLREKLGISEKSIPFSNSDMTVLDVWNLSTNDAEFPVSVLVCINMEYTDIHAQISDGDEVAFFPPVTGG